MNPRKILFVYVVLTLGAALAGSGITHPAEGTAGHQLIAAAESSSVDAVPLPKDVNIVSPDPSLSEETKAFSGKWYGVWDQTLEHVLVVEQIDPPTAEVIYAYGVAPEWGIKKGGWTRLEGKLEDGTLVVTTPAPATVTYRLMEDGTLNATYQAEGGVGKAKMEKKK